MNIDSIYIIFMVTGSVRLGIIRLTREVIEMARIVPRICEDCNEAPAIEEHQKCVKCAGPKKPMTLEMAKLMVERRIYTAGLIFEELERAGLIYGNGHHMAQKFAAEAVLQVEMRWLEAKEGGNRDVSQSESAVQQRGGGHL
jgi:hypothetical protein